MKMKLAIVATHPIQYQAPIWRILAQQPELDVHVYYGSDFSVRGYRDTEFGVTIKWDVPLTEGYVHTFLSNDPKINGLDGFFTLRATNLAQHLRQFRPDCALIGAYTPFFWWEAMGAIHLLRIPIFMRAETTDTAVSRNTLKRGVRSQILRWFYRQCTGFLAIGQNSRDHYITHGVNPGQIGWSPYCVDSDLLEQQVKAFLPRRAQLREELGFTADQRVLIYSGKLIPKKAPLILAQALLALPETERRRVGLIVVGDGELREKFEQMCRVALGKRAVFVGFVNQSEIGRYYAVSDCLVLPSAWGETWGLVVNEAMQFGVPVIVSSRVGCHRDLVVEGVTGYVFETEQFGHLEQRLTEMLNLSMSERLTMTEACRQRISRYSMHAAVNGIKEAICEVPVGMFQESK